MGIITDYFVAARAELADVAASAAVPATMPRVEAKGFHTVQLGRLAKMLATGDEGVEPGEPAHHGEGFAWFILDVTLPMTERLANLDDAEIAENGAAIAATPELGWPAAEGQRVLRELRAICKTALATNRSVHVFVST
jgi:hypothetical protein